MTDLQKVQHQLNKGLAELMSINLDENELLYDYIFEAHRLVKKLIIPDVGCCSCKIPEPRMKVSENGTSAYCIKCTKTYVQ